VRSASGILAVVSSPAVDAKSLRRDARRNRERLVASARELFAAAGVDVPVEEVTRRAGVGMGTLYRHFPTKEDLIDAVLEDAFSELVGLAERAAAAEDAWAGLTGFLEQVLARHAANRGLKDVIATRGHGSERAQAMRARIQPLLRRLIERAHEQGTLRADFTDADLPLAFWTGDRVIELTAAIAPDHWRRFLAVFLDGLRAGPAQGLPGRALTRAELASIARERAA
jgi:AcrR family transcriptional regulator